jgi:UDP-glucose 4-epimerase
LHIEILMRGERVLVTGGAGFIGSNLAEALAEESDVVILDDLSTGKLENVQGHDKKGAKL